MPFRPSHRQLEYLVMLGETGHFGEAAKRCNVSQPTLSVQVSLLEKQLGVTLIDRVPGRSRPRRWGRDIINAAKIILNGLDEITVLASSSKGNLGGAMRLGVAPSFGPYFLPYLLPKLHSQYPDLKLYIREDRRGFLRGLSCRGRRIADLARSPSTRTTSYPSRSAASGSFSPFRSEHPFRQAGQRSDGGVEGRSHADARPWSSADGRGAEACGHVRRYPGAGI